MSLLINNYYLLCVSVVNRRSNSPGLDPRLFDRARHNLYPFEVMCNINLSMVEELIVSYQLPASSMPP